MSAHAKRRQTAARAAFRTWASCKQGRPYAAVLTPDPLGEDNPDREDDFTDIVADLALLAKSLGYDTARLFRVAADHVHHAPDDDAAHDLADAMSRRKGARR